MNLTDLIESSAIEGQLASGASPSVIAARSSLSPRALIVLADKSADQKKRKQPKWSAEEDKFLKSCLGILPEKDIAQALGRTIPAVHIRWKRELKLSAPSKNRNIMTGNQIANGLGVDCKSIALLITRGILSGFELPSVRTMRVVKRITLLRFLTNPMNWIYFDPERVNFEAPIRSSKSYDIEFWNYARRLILKRKQLWKDEWWTPGQVAEYHGCDHRAVNKAIREERLPAIRWGNWCILKSIATEPSFKIRSFVKGGNHWPEYTKVTLRARAFILLAIAIGLQHDEIYKLTKWKNKKQIYYIFSMIKKYGLIQSLIDDNNLKVQYDISTGKVYADWKYYSYKFPFLARYMKSNMRSRNLTKTESKYINRIKNNAVMYKKLKSKR